MSASIAGADIGRVRRACRAFTLLLTCAACSAHSTGGPVVPPGPSGIFKIKHIVWIMQENRSFDNLFQGYPGADTRSSGEDSHGRIIPLRPISFAAGYDIDHSSNAFFKACNGTGRIRGTDCRMNGFDREFTYCSGRCPAHAQYGYIPHAESRLYFEMAHQYVLADRMFTSHLDLSYVSHQYMIAGQANRAVDFPSHVWGCVSGPNVILTLTDARRFGPYIPVCQNYKTLGDELDEAGLSWRLYTATKVSQWVAYRSIRHIRYGPDWNTNVVGSSFQIIHDVAKGRLADVTWVTPTTLNSDHAAFGSPTGPEWVSDVVNAIGQSRFWNSTAIFVMWDEWGGWYDHVEPPYLDFDGLGFRVPLLVISPYAKRGYVSHVQYEHGSILRFIEDRFSLPRLAASDRRANSPARDCFDFTQPPRKFTLFGTPLRAGDVQGLLRTESHADPDAQ
ncbi:MAG TPA: alkaline phosphatase family protein [Candidatus Cybelea sp.]